MASSEFTVSTHAYALLSQFDSDLKVEVKQSWIEEADLGLFAAADFKEGNVICCYVGKRLTTVEALRIEDKSYLMRLGNQAYIDAKDSMHCLARYINDCRNPAGYNATFTKLPDEWCALVVATKHINSGEEIFVDYGRWYWASLKPSRLSFSDLIRQRMQLGEATII